MKYVIVLLMSCFITGCFYQSTDITDILKAEQFCADKGGVRNIDVWHTGSEWVYCVDGTTENLMNVKLPNPVKR